MQCGLKHIFDLGSARRQRQTMEYSRNFCRRSAWISFGLSIESDQGSSHLEMFDFYHQIPTISVGKIQVSKNYVRVLAGKKGLRFEQRWTAEYLGPGRLEHFLQMEAITGFARNEQDLRTS
jgi:hypothetical protein